MLRSIIRAAASLAVLLGAAPVLPQAVIGGEWRDDIARFARRLVESRLTPGLSVAVSLGDGVLYSGGFGAADAEAGRGVSDSTAFYIASSTKALTATAVVLAAARGEIDLDAPVTRYIPGLRWRPPLDPASITVKSLLAMTHGLDPGGPVVFRTAYTGEFTNGLLIDLLGGYGPSAKSGGFEYGNLGYNVLGLVLDPNNEEGWKDVVERDVLRPLGMASTNARLSRLDPGRIAYPHELVPGQGFRRIRLGKADANLHAAGGHFATAEDLARFVAAHASGGLLEGRRVFPEDPIASMHEKRADQDRTFGPFHRFGWGYGWDLGSWEGKTIIHRFGSFPGYRSHVSFDPHSQIGVVVLANADGPASPAVDLLATFVYDRLLGRPDLEPAYRERLDRLVREAETWEREEAASLAKRRARLAPLPHPLGDYAGTYEDPKLGRMVWQVVAAGLEVRMGIARSRAEVYDAAKNLLRVEITGGGAVAGFEFPGGGGPASTVSFQGARFVRVAARGGRSGRTPMF
jgi:CubicO group peptidase (beta-lactamase class C family)